MLVLSFQVLYVAAVAAVLSPHEGDVLAGLDNYSCTVLYCTRSPGQLLLYCTVFVLGREEGYTVKYTPLPEVVPEGKARGNF